jgi:hypothetical protein
MTSVERLISPSIRLVPTALGIVLVKAVDGLGS